MRWVRRVLTALGFPLPLYDELREMETRAKAMRQDIRRERVSRDFAEAMPPPFWSREARHDY